MHKKNLVGNWFMETCSALPEKECFCQSFWVLVYKCWRWAWSPWRLHAWDSCRQPTEEPWWLAHLCCMCVSELQLVLFHRGCTRVLVVKNGRPTLYWRQLFVQGKVKLLIGRLITCKSSLSLRLVSSVVFGIFFIMNLILWGNKSSAAIPFSTLVALLALWICVSVPLSKYFWKFSSVLLTNYTIVIQELWDTR